VGIIVGRGVGIGVGVKVGVNSKVGIGARLGEGVGDLEMLPPSTFCDVFAPSTIVLFEKKSATKKSNKIRQNNTRGTRGLCIY